mmetsp:Transcript_82335/g.160644  ORF Transcript_82335/g.160644 Transcript_82335/m.160644 type:complete len:401 (-) Transcript_82335:117-1319(-)
MDVQEKQRQRWRKVVRYFYKGYSCQAIAKKLAVHRHTIESDLRALNIPPFSDMNDDELDELVAGEYVEAHLALGNHAIESRIMSLGHRVQRHRLRKCRVRLGLIRRKPKSIKRLKWYEARGPDGTWSMDQNEALQRYRISSFTIIDGYSRNPLFYALTTGLSGGDHTDFFCCALEKLHKLPACLAVDSTDSWNGVREIVQTAYGNNDATQVNVAGVPHGFRRFHQTLSIRNTPVERHWREWNPMLVKYYVRFMSLETAGILDPRSPVDLFCLHRVFLPSIQHTMNRHYKSLKLQKKRRSTLNPSYPEGTHRRSHIYKMHPSLAKRITATNAAGLRAVGMAYWAINRPVALANRPWEVDPVHTCAGRRKRARIITRRAPATLEEEYEIYRLLTLRISALGR